MKKLLIIDDHEVVRDGIKKIVGEVTAGIAFGEAGTAAEALRLIEQEAWDAAIVDLSLAGTSGLELLKQIKLFRPKLPILILSMHSERQYAKRAFKAGAAGYVTKDSPRAEVAKAIRRVIDGGRYVSPALAEDLTLDLERGPDQLPQDALSDREYEVMRLIASGKTVGEIAGMLFLSDKTVSTYRARILEKMQMKTNAEMTRYAIENNLVD
jgi:two-component system invasion response regulator UvrY